MWEAEAGVQTIPEVMFSLNHDLGGQTGVSLRPLLSGSRHDDARSTELPDTKATSTEGTSSSAVTSSLPSAEAWPPRRFQALATPGPPSSSLPSIVSTAFRSTAKPFSVHVKTGLSS